MSLHSPLIVFDLDGTLVDSRRDLANAVNAVLGELGAKALPVSEVTGMVGEGARVLVDRALKATGQPSDVLPRALDRFLEIYDTHLLDHTRPYDGVPGMLERLSSIATLAVLTNKPSQATARVLHGLGLSRHFAHIVGGDGDYPRKPDPSALWHLMASCEVGPEQALMVGDSPIDLATARNAGVACCLVQYGFGFPAELVRQAGIFVAETPESVVDICLQSLRRGR